MKLYNRYKILAAIGIICMVYFITDYPLSQTLFNKNTVVDEYNLITKIYDGMSENFNTKDYYKDKRKKLLVEITELNVFSGIWQEEIIGILKKHINNNNIKITNITFSEAYPLQTNGKTEDDSIEDIMTPLIMAVKLKFSAGYDEMLAFIDDLQSNPTDIAVYNINVTFTEEFVYGEMGLNFYAIPLDKH